MANVFGTVLERLLGSREVGTYDVIVRRSSEFAARSVKARHECLVMYADAENQLEIVFEQPYSRSKGQNLSVFRSADIALAWDYFSALKNVIPQLCDVWPDSLMSQAGVKRACSVLQEHPSYCVSHLIICLEGYEPLRKVPDYVNYQDCDGITPIHLAVQKKLIPAINVLVDMDVRLDILDKNENSVFHYAASSSKEVIEALCNKYNKDESCPLLNDKNCEGYTALHIACLNDKPDCVKALLRAGADIHVSGNQTNNKNFTGSPRTAREIIDLYSQELHDWDIKNGGTPLHWAKTRQVIQAVVELGCNIELRNFNGNTALQVMVMHGRLPCVIELLCSNADPNVKDPEGNTSLHMAVMVGNIAITQALICFGADMAVVNDKGDSPRHCTPLSAQCDKILYTLDASGAPRCGVRTGGCYPGCAYGDTYNGVPIDVKPPSRQRDKFDEYVRRAMLDDIRVSLNAGDFRKCRLLSLDGGGIKGLVLVQVLMVIEEVAEVPIRDLFDWIAGTSTGGILAMAITNGKNLKECQSMYLKFKDRVFMGSKPYDEGPLNSFLIDLFGESRTMADLPERPKLFATAVCCDRSPADLHLFRNYTEPKEILKIEDTDQCPFEKLPKPEDQLVWRAARSTGAAPGFFRASGYFLDGGLIANNPTLDLLTEVHEYNFAQRHMGRFEEVMKPTVLVSVGTGKPPAAKIGVIDVCRPDSLWNACKAAVTAVNFVTLLVNQTTETDNRVVDRCQAWSGMLGIPFFRFNPQLSSEVVLNEKNDEILCHLLWQTKAYMHSIRDEVKALVKLLKY